MVVLQRGWNYNSRITGVWWENKKVFSVLLANVGKCTEKMVAHHLLLFTSICCAFSHPCTCSAWQTPSQTSKPSTSVSSLVTFPDLCQQSHSHALLFPFSAAFLLVTSLRQYYKYHWWYLCKTVAMALPSAYSAPNTVLSRKNQRVWWQS